MTRDEHRDAAQSGGDGADEPQRRPGDPQQDEQGPGGRSAAEWTTLAISLALILGLAGLVTYLYLSGANRPPLIEATPLAQESWRDGDLYYLPVRVTNRGDQTAADVQVRAELAAGDGAPETAEFTITYLAGGETTRGTAVFSIDPLAGDLTVAVTSFRHP